jgi:hypothetical protein
LPIGPPVFAANRSSVSAFSGMFNLYRTSPMIRILAALALTATLAASLAEPVAAAAADTGTESPVSAAFGNTIVSTYPDGRVGKLWLSSDGTYEAQGRRHDASNGHWSVKGGKLCLKQAKPMSVPFSFCTPIPAGGLDKAWSAKAVTGEAIRVQVVKGKA